MKGCSQVLLLGATMLCVDRASAMGSLVASRAGGAGPEPPRQVLDAYRCLKNGADAHLPHCDQTKTDAQRVDSIVANLTAAELVAIMNKEPVDRLQIGSYAMWTAEALHGVRLWPERCPFSDRCTTIFPTASTASRAFNTSLWTAIGEAIGTEARVLWNLGILDDLSLRGPQVNIQVRHTSHLASETILSDHLSLTVLACFSGTHAGDETPIHHQVRPIAHALFAQSHCRLD
jgi:hypothetical protein